MPTPSHPRLVTVSLHRLASARIPLASIGAPYTTYPSDTIELLTSQALSLLNSLSYSLCILPVTLPVNLTHYAQSDLAALTSLNRRLDDLGFNCLATFSTHPFCLYSPLATHRLPDFLRSSDLLVAPGHLVDLKPTPPTAPPARPSPAPTPTPPADDPRRDSFEEPCPCCRRIDCVCPQGCFNCA